MAIIHFNSLIPLILAFLCILQCTSLIIRPLRYMKSSQSRDINRKDQSYLEHMFIEPLYSSKQPLFDPDGSSYSSMIQERQGESDVSSFRNSLAMNWLHGGYYKVSSSFLLSSLLFLFLSFTLTCVSL